MNVIYSASTFDRFTSGISIFTLILMSTSLHGNRFLNLFMTEAMELPASVLFYLIADRSVGRNKNEAYKTLKRTLI